MRSKTSYFNPTLFRKNLARFWPLWGGASLLGAMAPLGLLMALLDLGRDSFPQPLEMTLAYYSAVSYIVPVVSLFYAILCGLSVWHYLYNHRSVSLYHSLPITRKGLFGTNFLSGMAMMLIPYAVTGGLAVLVTLATGCLDPKGVLITILAVAGQSFFYFATATLVAFVTGNPFACAAFYFIFHFLAAAAEFLVGLLMTAFYFGVDRPYQGTVEFLSPTLYLCHKLSPYGETGDTFTPDGWVDHGVYSFATLRNGWLIAVYVLAGLALAWCAWMLYSRRRSESAGEVVAVGWMKPVFRWGVTLCSAAAGGLLLYMLLWNDTFQRGSTADALPMTLCMAFAGVIGYYAASMLLAKSLRVFRGSWKGVLATVLAAGALCAAVALDPAGVEAYVPAAEDVAWVRVSLRGDYRGGNGATLDDPASIQKVLALHERVLAEQALLDRGEGDFNCEIDFYYVEKDGSSTDRWYSFRCPEDLASEAMDLAQDLATDPVFQESNIFDLVQDERVLSKQLMGGYLDSVYNQETQAQEDVVLDPAQAQALEEAVRRDIAAGHFGKTTFMKEEDYLDAVLYSDLHLNYKVTYVQDTPIDAPADQTYTNTVNITLSRYCTETLKALEDLGVLEDSQRILTSRERREGFRRDEYGGIIPTDGYDGAYYGEDWYEDPYDTAGIEYPASELVNEGSF